MPLKKPVVDDSTRQAFVKGIADFTALGDLGETPVWQVYNVGLPDLAAGLGVANAKPSAWRFLAADVSGTAIAGEVPNATQDRGWLMTSLSHGPHIAAALQASVDLEALDEVQSLDYDLLTLRIPGLLIEAFWLKPRAGGAELVVPYITRSKQVELFHKYTMDEFLNIVRPMAIKRLTFDGPGTDAGS